MTKEHVHEYELRFVYGPFGMLWTEFLFCKCGDARYTDGRPVGGASQCQ